MAPSNAPWISTEPDGSPDRMKTHSSLALLTGLLALSIVGCAPVYPDTTAGRSCRHSIEVCGDTLLTPQQCLDAAQVAYDVNPGCRAQLDAHYECLVRNGTAGCGAFIMVCQAELTAVQSCQSGI